MHHSDRTLFHASVILACCCCGRDTPAQLVEARPTRVLVLYQQQAETRPMLEFSERFRRTLQGEMRSPVEFYQESLDVDRFAERERSSSLLGYFQDKYRSLGIDVVVAVGERARRFAVVPLNAVPPAVRFVFLFRPGP